MKITQDHYQHMKDAIAAVIRKLGFTAIEQHKKRIAEDGRVKDAEMRFRWDLFHAAGLSTYAVDTLYPYANDTHIDTALRRIMATVPFPTR